MIVDLGGGSGGSSKGVCAIKASWEEGYTCICYSGNKKLKAGKDVTEWIFLLPFAGDWTVEAGDLSEPVTVAVGEVKEVEISHELVLWEKYNNNTAVTGGWNTASTQTANEYFAATDTALRIGGHTTDAMSHQYMGTKNKIDFSKYSQLVIDIAAHSGDDFQIGPSTKSAASSGFVASIKPTAKGVYTLDISGVNSSYYLNMRHTNNALTRHYVSFNSIKLVR